MAILVGGNTVDRPRTSEEYDCKPVPCTKSCIIFTNARTGSSWLSIGLYRVGLGVPMEYFHKRYIQQIKNRNIVRKNHDEELLSAYIRSVTNIRTTPNGVFGVKIHTNQWVDLCLVNDPNQKQTPSYYRKQLENAFVHPHFIFLYRKDILSQAISLYIAQESQSWSSEVPAKKSIEYDFAKIKLYLDATMKNIKICRSIHQVTTFPKLSMTYEDLEADYYGSIQKVASFLNEDIILTEDIGRNTCEKQGNQRNEEWKDRFLSDLKKNK
ncbi:MAG: hypothetical protein CL916_04230 [Deltaproteobacteria bacterium]|nr:hypothetical protein [Deltaproteobacteria bacterium]